MATAIDLLRQGRREELWQLGCGFTSLNIEQFMAIQRRLLLEQMELLGKSPLGLKIMRGSRPRTVEEFRQQVPLTTYSDYCPELLERQEENLPARPETWVHTSGRSGEYPFKWVPMTPAFVRELSALIYGVGTLSSCQRYGDTSRMPEVPNIIYTVAPRPYVSGTMASMIEYQTPLKCMPPMEIAEAMTFEERIKAGFDLALSEGLDFFFGLSLVLVAVGDKFTQSSGKVNLLPLLRRPRALMRLLRGVARSKLARRHLLPKDLWDVRGIISSGLDSWVYRSRIKELWGKYPLDLYAASESGIIATQTWDYTGMTFVPNLNFLEFIPEKEHWKWQLDRSYQPGTVLLDEVVPGENYELVLTNFHGGALVRYRIGDMIKITGLRNENTGIELPQMVFERRADGLLDFFVVRLTEKTIWQAIENTGLGYVDWTAYKEPGKAVLKLLIELKDGTGADEREVAAAVHHQIMDSESAEHKASMLDKDLSETLDFSVDVTLLRQGAFASYTRQKQEEGADLAHLKPPHINPSEKVLAALQARPEVKVRVKAPTGVDAGKVAA